MTVLPPELRAYRIGTTLLAPAAPAWLRRRARLGKEDPARLPEKLGHGSIARPPGPLAWAHGASIGETLSLLPLVEALNGRGLPVLVTSGTRTAASVLAHRLPAGARHQYAPLDLPSVLRRFLDHWRPDVALLAESEIWPNTVLELSTRGIPLLLVNGRLSGRSFERWKRRPRLAAALFGRLAVCIAQSQADAERLNAVGAPVAGVAGNLKFDGVPPAADPATVERLAASLAGRPLWMAASTHRGEDDAVLAAHARAASRAPGLLTIIAPRHPERGDEVSDLAAAAGLAVDRRSRGEPVGGSADIHLVDTVGDLGLFYRLAPIVFVGGSLVRKGGQNPVEPAQLGAALLHGPHTDNFADAYAALDAAGAALRLADADALAPALVHLLADPGLVRDMARAALATASDLGGALGRTLAAIESWLPRPSGVARTTW